MGLDFDYEHVCDKKTHKNAASRSADLISEKILL